MMMMMMMLSLSVSVVVQQDRINTLHCYETYTQ